MRLKANFSFITHLCLFILALSISGQLRAENTLERHFELVASTLKGNLGVSALHIETGESISFNGGKKFPMQSVYKFPIAMVMLREIDLNNFSLDNTITINTGQYITPRPVIVP